MNFSGAPSIFFQKVCWKIIGLIEKITFFIDFSSAEMSYYTLCILTPRRSEEKVKIFDEKVNFSIGPFPLQEVINIFMVIGTIEFFTIIFSVKTR